MGLIPASLTNTDPIFPRVRITLEQPRLRNSFADLLASSIELTGFPHKDAA